MPDFDYVVTQPWGDYVVGQMLDVAPDEAHAHRVVRVAKAEVVPAAAEPAASALPSLMAPPVASPAEGH